jgi:hypothetical protein
MDEFSLPQVKKSANFSCLTVQDLISAERRNIDHCSWVEIQSVFTFEITVLIGIDWKRLPRNRSMKLFVLSALKVFLMKPLKRLSTEPHFIKIM